MRAKELRERSLDELVVLKTEAAEQLFRNRIKNATHQLVDTSLVRKGRRELARIECIMNEKRDAAVKSGKGEE